MSRHEELTQQYSTWGDKLLQHTDVLYSIQLGRKFKPITIQLAPTELCNSDCPFCSVAGRPIKSYMPFSQIQQVLHDFADLGAKAVEITGGGNPMLYRDRGTGTTINDIVREAWDLGLSVGIITNSHDLSRLKPEVHNKVSWIRVSLIQLDEGRQPEDYNFAGFPEERIGFSYIIYETGGVQDALSRTNRTYKGTTNETIRRMARLVELHPKVKFVRIAGNCLIKGNNAKVREQWREVIDEIDRNGKFFVKDIGNDDGPFDGGCYVGMVRPYIAPDPRGGDYKVYICTSHVLNTRTYDPAYALCSVADVKVVWEEMNLRFASFGHPYEVKGNKGKNWCGTCKFCYYKNNNAILHAVSHDLPDKNFA
jgi:hypothetical protein